MAARQSQRRHERGRSRIRCRCLRSLSMRSVHTSVVWRQTSGCVGARLPTPINHVLMNIHLPTAFASESLMSSNFRACERESFHSPPVSSEKNQPASTCSGKFLMMTSSQQAKPAALRCEPSGSDERKMIESRFIRLTMSGVCDSVVWC